MLTFFSFAIWNAPTSVRVSAASQFLGFSRFLGLGLWSAESPWLMGQWNHWADNSWEMWNPFSCLHAGEKPEGFFLWSGAEKSSLTLPGSSWLLLQLGWCHSSSGWAVRHWGHPSPTPALLGREQEELMDHGWAVQGEELESCELTLCRETLWRGSFKYNGKVAECPKNGVARQDGNLSTPVLAVGLHWPAGVVPAHCRGVGMVIFGDVFPPKVFHGPGSALCSTRSSLTSQLVLSHLILPSD